MDSEAPDLTLIEPSEAEMARRGERIGASLAAGPVRLRFDEIRPGDPAKGLAPQYHFKILGKDGTVAGHLNFRVGSSRHVLMTAGHVGYEVLLEHRGQGLSYHACRAIAPFVREHYESVILTTEAGNKPSMRTIEKLGARFLGEVDVPPDDPGYKTGGRRRRRYEWDLTHVLEPPLERLDR